MKMTFEDALVIANTEYDHESLKRIRGFEHFSPEQQSELCLVAVKKDALAMMFVPEELKSYELCLEAVSQATKVLPYIPDKYKTPELVLKAVKTGAVFDYDDLPSNYWDSNGNLLSYEELERVWAEMHPEEDDTPVPSR